jgi:hypothetical protein
MPNCKKYSELSIPEKTIAIGKIIHLFQNDDHYFDAFMSIIRQAENTGHFEDVTILPESTE